MSRDPGNERKKRGLINVAEREMVGAGEVVQRVAEVAVARGRRHVQSEIAERNKVNPRPQRKPGRGVMLEERGGQGEQE